MANQDELYKANISPTNSINCDRILEFESPEGSPYTRRHPAVHRLYRESYLKANQPTTNWTPNASDQDENSIHSREDDIHEHALPITLQRHQSMQSLRHRRDPHYQGIRSRKAKRVIDRDGERNIVFTHIPEKSMKFFKDFVTTLVEEQWRYTITVFALSFFLCWIAFALLWYLIAYGHGDLNMDPITGERLSDGPLPCVEGATTFAGFLLFSIETQVSIGYGSRYPNEVCPEGIFLMVLQIISGICIEGAMVGIVYAKMVRPPKHASDMSFSKKAIICQRDSKLCLVFRICDTKQSHVVASQVHVYWFEEKYSLEGERLPQFQHSLRLENDGKIFLILPLTIAHVIDETSPLYDLSAKDLLEKKFEIVITFTGSSRSTGQMTQTRTSYLPKEILWGYRFVNIVQYDRKQQTYIVDYDKFEETEQIDTPLCSARRLEEVIHEIQSITNENPEDFYTDNMTYATPNIHYEAMEHYEEIRIQPQNYNEPKKYENEDMENHHNTELLQRQKNASLEILISK